MGGYLNRFITSACPTLPTSTKPPGQALCWVMIRNQRLIPGSDLLADANVAVGPDGRPVDSGAAAESTFDMTTKVIIAGNVCDAKWLPEIDEHGTPVDPPAEPPLLPMPPSDGGLAHALTTPDHRKQSRGARGRRNRGLLPAAARADRAAR